MSLLYITAAACESAERQSTERTNYQETQDPLCRRRPEHTRQQASKSMGIDAATAAEVSAVVALAVLMVAIVAASAAGRARAAAVHDDVELALGADTLVTYEQAARVPTRHPSTEEEKEDPRDCCAFCLSEYAGAGELVRVVPACRHFFHAECGVDGWLRKRGTCPLCRGRVTPLPKLPRPECPPLPARARGDAWGLPYRVHLLLGHY